MTVQALIIILAFFAVIFFYKNFNASIYFIVLVDIFLRIVTYLKENILKDGAFSFLDNIPENIPDLINSFNLDICNDILIGAYVVVYIIFEALIVRMFVKKKFK